MAQNTSKNRKSESQEIFEQAENAGRFAGKDTDAQSAKKQAIDIRRIVSHRERRGTRMRIRMLMQEEILHDRKTIKAKLKT